jgi:hypothetical protein
LVPNVVAQIFSGEIASVEEETPIDILTGEVFSATGSQNDLSEEEEISLDS